MMLTCSSQKFQTPNKLMMLTSSPQRPTKLGKKGEHGGEEEDEEEDITLLMTSRWIQAAIDAFLGFAICS